MDTKDVKTVTYTALSKSYSVTVSSNVAHKIIEEVLRQAETQYILSGDGENIFIPMGLDRRENYYDRFSKASPYRTPFKGWPFSDIEHDRERNNLAAAIFKAFASKQDWEILIAGQQKVHDKLLEFAHTIPETSTSKQLSRRLNYSKTDSDVEIRGYLSNHYTVLTPNSREHANFANIILHFIFTHPNRDSIQYFNTWHGFRIPEIIEDVMHNPMRSDLKGLPIDNTPRAFFEEVSLRLDKFVVNDGDKATKPVGCRGLADILLGVRMYPIYKFIKSLNQENQLERPILRGPVILSLRDLDGLDSGTEPSESNHFPADMAKDATTQSRPRRERKEKGGKVGLGKQKPIDGSFGRAARGEHIGGYYDDDDNRVETSGPKQGSRKPS